MKTIFRIPTQEPYAYIEIEGEEESFESALVKYKEMISMAKGEAGTGLDTKVWNGVLDEYLTTGHIANGADLYAQMGRDQRLVVQEIKKSHKRTNI